MEYGLIGAKLGHSHSPRIHGAFFDYSYTLRELTAEELPHIRPLYKDFMYWPRALHLLRVPVEIPPQYTLVGILPPFTDKPCLSYRRPGRREHRIPQLEERQSSGL